MLVTFRARRAVVVLPTSILSAGIGTLVFAARATSAGRHGLFWVAAIGLGLLGIALDELTIAWLQAGKLHVRGAFRRDRLDGAACAVGLRFEGSGRHYAFHVFVTDSTAHVNLGRWMTEKSARRAAKRVRTALFDAAHTGSARALGDVAAIEGVWLANKANAKQQTDAFYRSPAWKRVKFLIVGFLVIYTLSMLVYQYITGQL